MGFLCGIVGIPNAGKSTLFNLLTQAAAPAENYPFCTVDPNIGIVTVPDENLERIASHIHPEKITPTTLKIFDIAGLVQGAHRGEGLGNQFLGQIRGVDTIIHVVRCFENPNISHVYNAVNPVQDMEIVLIELVMADLEIVQHRQESVSKALRVGKRELSLGEEDQLSRMKDHLSRGEPLSSNLPVGERSLMKAWGILTAKPAVIVANIDEDDLTGESPHLKHIQDWGQAHGVPVIPICIRFEQEASQLDPHERSAFLESVGITSSGTHDLIRTCYELLDLITFYTPVGPELRAWTLQRGQTLHEAAGLVHTDIQKGFIRADVIALKDFLAHGSIARAREAGVVLTEGREFVVRDTDIVVIHFR